MILASKILRMMRHALLFCGNYCDMMYSVNLVLLAMVHIYNYIYMYRYVHYDNKYSFAKIDFTMYNVCSL